MGGCLCLLWPFLPELAGEMLAEVVRRKGGRRELKVLPVFWFDGLARILSKVEETGVWPEGLLHAYIALIPKTDGDIHLFAVDGIKSSDTVDRAILGTVLSSFAWLWHACFEYHSHVRLRLRFELAACLGKSWTLDGGIPQGFPLSMMFILALYLPWCRYLAAQEGVEPQLYAHNFKCVSGDPGVLLRAAKFTTRDCVSKRTDCRPTPFLMPCKWLAYAGFKSFWAPSNNPAGGCCWLRRTASTRGQAQRGCAGGTRSLCALHCASRHLGAVIAYTVYLVIGHSDGSINQAMLDVMLRHAGIAGSLFISGRDWQMELEQLLAVPSVRASGAEAMAGTISSHKVSSHDWAFFLVSSLRQKGCGRRPKCWSASLARHTGPSGWLRWPSPACR